MVADTLSENVRTHLKVTPNESTSQELVLGFLTLEIFDCNVKFGDLLLHHMSVTIEG